MTTLKRYLNEANKNVKSMVDFIYKNQNLIDTYDVEDLWEKTARARFKKDTGFYPTTSRYEWTISELGWKAENTNNRNYEDILKDFQNHQGATGLSPMEQKEKTSFTSLLQYARWEPSKGELKGIGEYNLNTLIWFLRYVTSGKLDANLAQANKVMEDRGWSYSSDFRNEKLPEVGGIYLSKFKNGKIIIKGLKRKDLETINRIIGMIKKY